MPELSILTRTEPSSTDLGIYDIRRLEGPHVTLTPYDRGFYRRDLVYQLWALMEKEQAIDWVFYETPLQDEAKHAHGDMVHFINYFDDPCKIILVVQHNESQEIAGLCWFDIQCDRFRALANWWIRRKFWGKPAREAGVIACDYIFHNLKIPHIWGYSPWLTSAKSGMSFGFDYVVALPDYVRAKGKVMDMHVVYLSQQKFEAGQYYENLHRTVN